VPAKAWPYAVTRGELTGYQAVLVPGFLADAGLTYVLEYASRQETDEPGTATVREVLGAPGTLSLAYRVREARGDRYGLGDEEVLEDINGRPIRVFEGLVLPLPAPEVASLGLTTRDLDAVARLAAPLLRKLWKAETSLEAEPSGPRLVGNADPAEWPLKMQVAKPYVIPGSDVGPVPPKPHSDRRPHDRIPAEDSYAAVGSHPRPDVEEPSPPAWEREQGLPPWVRKLIAITAAVVALVVVILFLSKVFSSPPSTQNGNYQAANTTVSQFCVELSGGKVSDAYQELSAAYRKLTKQSAFKASLLGSDSKADCTSTKVTQAGDQATLGLQRAGNSHETAHLTFQEESGKWQATNISVSS
jgi:hypothetical protein